MPPAILPLPIAAGQGPFRIKGSIYQGFVEAARHTKTMAKWTSLLEPTTSAFASQIFLASGWYDAFPVIPLTDALARTLGHTFEEVVKRGAKRRVTEDLETVYRIELKRASPGAVASRLARGFDRYFGFGRAETERADDRGAQISMLGVPDYVAYWYRVSTTTFFEVVLRMAGAAAVHASWVEEPDASAEGFKTRRFVCTLTWA